MSVTIKKTDKELWTVGVLDRGGWEPLRDCSSKDEAMAWLSYLNGGEHPDWRRSLGEAP